MQYICVFSAFFMAMVLYIKTKKIYNPGTIFLGYWSFITFLASLGLDGAPEIQQTTYLFIFLGLFCFGAGAYMCLIIRQNIVAKPTFDMQIKDYHLLYMVCIAIIAYSFYRLSIIASYLMQDLSWGTIRLMHGIAGSTGADTLKGETLSQVVHDNMIAPCTYLIAPVFAVELFLGKRDKKFIILSLLAMIFYSLASVSRAIWGFLILYMGIILIIFMKRQNIPHKVKRWIKKIPIFAAILFIVILIITKMRSETSQINLLYNMLAYLSGGINLFDIHLKEQIASIRTYGAFSLYGFIYPVFFVLNYLDILKYPAVFSDISYIKQSLELYVPISDHVTMNAYSTLFFNFYNDFGVFGICFGSFIFGYLCMLSYKYFIKKKDLRTFVCYLILVQFMIFSVARLYTIYTTRALSLVWLLILLPKVGGKKLKVKL